VGESHANDVGNMGVIQGIKNIPTHPTRPYQTKRPEKPQLMGNSRLSVAADFGKFPGQAFPGHQGTQDLKPGRITHSLEQLRRLLQNFRVARKFMHT